MFHQDQQQGVVVNYNVDKVFDALIKGIDNLKGFKIKNQNKITHSISINVGASLFSWGELMNVSLIDLNNEKTQINISSGSKLGTELVANSKNRKNIDKLMNAMTEFLD